MSVNLSTILDLLGTYPYYSYYTLTALFFSTILFRQLKKKKGSNGNPKGLPLPPGPKGYPLIGNLFDMAVDQPWIVFGGWRKTYGKNFYHRWSVLHKYKITRYFRWYNTPQCPWPALCNTKFLGSHLRLVWEEIFKLFGQKTNDYVQWIVYIKHFTSKKKKPC